jgi:hypothetical protein
MIHLGEAVKEKGGRKRFKCELIDVIKMCSEQENERKTFGVRALQVIDIMKGRCPASERRIISVLSGV